MQPLINAYDIQKMIRHWLETPINGYLGSGYGQDLKSLLQQALSSNAPDEFLAKLRKDIPILDALPPSAVNLYAESVSLDKIEIFLEISGQKIKLN